MNFHRRAVKILSKWELKQNRSNNKGKRWKWEDDRSRKLMFQENTERWLNNGRQNGQRNPKAMLGRESLGNILWWMDTEENERKDLMTKEQKRKKGEQSTTVVWKQRENRSSVGVCCGFMHWAYIQENTVLFPQYLCAIHRNTVTFSLSPLNFRNCHNNVFENSLTWINFI